MLFPFAIPCTPVVLGLTPASPARPPAPPRAGLVLHLDAAAIPAAGRLIHGKVARWPDRSGKGRDVRQPQPALRPLFVPRGLHGLPVVHFSGRQYLDGPPPLPAGTKNFTFAAVWRRTTRQGAEVIFGQAAPGKGRRAALLTLNGRYGFNGEGNDQHALLPYRPGCFTVSVLTLDAAGTVRLRHNDDAAGTGMRGWINPRLQILGARLFRVGAKATTGGERLHGDIAEILVYDHRLRFREIRALDEYLGRKWGIAPKGPNGNRRILTMTPEQIDKTPDYTSKVPHFTFANTLAQQETQLKNNPLLERFAQSRRRLASDPWRPRYHFVSPESSMNDPNGLCFWKGRWHLFYQAYPPEDPRQHWGHAVSTDLVHWRDLPYAIYPNPEEKCFSGATLVEPDRVIAIYHGVKAGTMIAVSDDPLLLNWKKVAGRAVIPFPKPGDPPLPYNIFDPCIWKKDGAWYALTAGTLPRGPGGKRLRTWFLHRSTDLAHWKYLHPFVENDHYGLVGDDGACPYFLPIGDKYILLHFSHLSGGKYLIGDYDKARDKFVVLNGGDFNFGPVAPGGVHAPSACPDGKGGVIAIFNMNPAKPTKGWNQIMSLPRRLTLVNGQELAQAPAGDFASLRYDHRRVGPTPLPANREVVFHDLHGKSIEILAEFDPVEAPVLELDVLRSPGKEEYTRIALYPGRGYQRERRGLTPAGMDSMVVLDLSHASTLPDVQARPPEIAPVYLPPGQPLRLHVFVDRSIVEVFVNDQQCVAARVYPGREDSAGVSICSRGRPAALTALDLWQMRM